VRKILEFMKRWMNLRGSLIQSGASHSYPYSVIFFCPRGIVLIGLLSSTVTTTLFEINYA
jgi:hypothetical protein